MQIELSGGIGNQLFQYSMGKYLQRKQGVELTFVSASTGLRETPHNSKLGDFEFGFNVKILNRSRLKVFFSTVDRYLSYRVAIYKTLASQLFKSYTQLGVGYDEKIVELPRPRSVRGHFQSYLYVESIKSELISEFELVAPSERYLSYATQAKVIAPIIVHLRRGDYKHLSTSVGILSADYYFNGLKALSSFIGQKQIWIFSDDQKASFALATRLEEMGLKDIKKGFELTDSETLKLMSLGSGIVIANSTFSWWSAFLGNYGNNVVAPREWYKGMPNPKDLIPKSWKLVASSWE